MPRLELHDPFGTKLHERAARLVKGLFTVEFSLGEKLVGIADNLLFEGLGLQPRKPSARVACAYPPYAKRIVNGNGNANGNGNTEKDKALDKVMQMVLDMRQKAKEEKNWAVSDQIRDELSAAGVIVKDTPDGAVWEI